MLGAAALASLSAMRSGAGLVTLGVPKSMNTAAQKKISHTVMTLPLCETRQQTLSAEGFRQIRNFYRSFSVIAIGPGLSAHPSTQRLIIRIIETSPLPLVIDADALNALSNSMNSLTKTKTVKILTPHPGEMARLTGKSKQAIEKARRKAALDLARKYDCTVLLKGARTVVASPKGKVYTNASGNAGMATAGCGDVLTGMIAAFLAQGLDGFQAARCAAYVHGKAGDLAAKAKTRLAMIATDLIDFIPKAVQSVSK